MRNKILIDANSVGFYAHQHNPQTRAGEQATGAVQGALSTLHHIATSRPGCSLIALWDGRSWRRDALPEYKAQREKTPKQREERAAYHSQTPFIKRAFRALGVSNVQASNLEADDLAALLSERYSRAGDRVALYTRDRDWLQLVRPGVTWHDHATTDRVSHVNFAKETGYAGTSAFTQAKALMGDRGDNIGGVGGIGEVNAKKLLAVWPTVRDFLADQNPGVAWSERGGHKTIFNAAIAKLHMHPEAQDLFARNMRLMDLTDTSILPAPKQLTIDRGAFDEKDFKLVCFELGLHRVLQDFATFVSPFNLEHA